MRPYLPCRFCNDRGCLACDQERVIRAQVRRGQAEALDFMRRYHHKDVGTGIETVTLPSPEDLAADAIQYGKEMARREMQAERPQGDALAQRFARVEFDGPVDAEGQAGGRNVSHAQERHG